MKKVRSLSYDHEDALAKGWEHFDHKGGQWSGYDQKASLIITGLRPYKKDIKIDIQ